MRRLSWLGVMLVWVTVPRLSLGQVLAPHANTLEQELKLARAEGIPTTPAEYAATIRQARPEENAAPIYTSLRGKWPSRTEVIAPRAITFDQSDSAANEARAFLDSQKSNLTLIDQAAILPRCWFDRDWTLGVAVLMPEYADIKQAAKFLALRGSLAARDGHPDLALADARRIFRLADHAGETPMTLPRLVCRAIYTIGLRTVADWAFQYRNCPNYRDALRDAAANFPPQNLRKERSFDLVEILSTIELCSTRAGREKIGLKQENEIEGDVSFSEFFPPDQGKIWVVEGIRGRWAAFELSPKVRTVRLNEANLTFYKGLFVYPTARLVFESMSGEDEDPLLIASYESDVMCITALVRALCGTTIPRSIKTSDLRLPTTGKLLQYSFDGKQMTIDAGKYLHGWASSLSFPPKPGAK